MDFDRKLDLIRRGEIPLEFDGTGKPVLSREPMYERMQFLQALAEGYTRNYNKLHSFRNFARAETSIERKEPCIATDEK